MSHRHHLVQHIHHPDLRSDSTLHVVGVVSNPERFHSRYRLAREWFAEMEATPFVRPYLVEAAFADRHYEVAAEAHERHLRLHTYSSIWIKESMINLGVRELLPLDWRYVAWVDADITFRDPNWALEALQQLQHFEIIQPWQTCADLGFHGDIQTLFRSFGYRIQSDGLPLQRCALDGYPYGHTGYAWACTRTFWERVGGLIDFAILGSADHHMAFSMVGEGPETVHEGVGESYRRRLREWQARAMPLTHGEVGFSVGRIEHHFHGPKRGRGYQSRWKILVDHHYDPDVDLIHDAQGLVALAGNKPQLEISIRKYNRSRREDSIEDL